MLVVFLTKLHNGIADLRRQIGIETKIFLIKTKRLFFPAKIRKAANGKLNLHLGCGAVNHPKFINIDAFPHPHVHYVQKIDNLKRFKAETVDLIYAAHCLEHFKYHHTMDVLKEWRRVLKKGGIIRLSVPDFDKLLAIFLENNNDPDTILPQVMGGQENQYNFHLTILNRVNLSRLLYSAGFSNIRDWVPGQDDLTTFKDFSIYKKVVNDKNYEISLNLEAVK